MSSLVRDLSDGVKLIQLMVRMQRLSTAMSTLMFNRKSWVRYPPSSVRDIGQLNRHIGDTSLGRYNKNPRIRVQKAENVNKALEFIQSRGVKLTNIGPEGQ